MTDNYSYEAWKESSDLEAVCSQLLDNANMDVKFTDCPFSIALSFCVIGSDIKVNFTCSDIAKFSIVKDSENGPIYVALEASVIPPIKLRDPNMSDHEFNMIDHKDYVWEVNVLPEADICIKCISFKWEIMQISEEEMKWLN